MHMDFTQARIIAGLSASACADLFGVSIRTVRRWESDSPPRPVALLLDYLGGGWLPGSSARWDGWTFRGDSLWSPAGEPFGPGDLYRLHWQDQQQWSMRARIRKLEADLSAALAGDILPLPWAVTA